METKLIYMVGFLFGILCLMAVRDTCRRYGMSGSEAVLAIVTAILIIIVILS